MKGEGQETKTSLGSRAVVGHLKIMVVLGFQSSQESSQTLKKLIPILAFSSSADVVFGVLVCSVVV